MTRKQIRYLLFRLKNELENGVPVGGLPDNFKAAFIHQKKFQGFNNFGVSWDVGGRIPNEQFPHEDATTKEPSAWVIVMRDESLDDAWNRVLSKVVVTLP